MIKRTVSLILSLALLVNSVQPIHAADLVAIPQNVHLPTPPSSIQTRSSELSFKSIETKINNVLKPEKTQPKVADTYSGSCGTNVKWNLDTSTGILTISGSGAINNYFVSPYHPYAPWHSYKFQIKTVVIENGVTSIGSHAFYDCSELTSVTIPDSVTNIDEYAFGYCDNLTSVTIPDSVTNIDEYAFRNCDSLTSVTIPDSVTSIGNYAFDCCDGLTSVTIPDSVTSIGFGAFNGCSGLTSITVDPANSQYKSIDGVLFNKDGTSLIYYPTGKSGSYTIPSSVTSIGSSAFSHCPGLTSVTIPDSVTNIGAHAFYGCTRLRSVTIPGSVTSIGIGAFYGCSWLNSVTYEGTSDPGSTSNDVFCNTQVTKVNVPSNYKSTTFCGVTVEKVPGLCIVTGNCGTNVSYSLNTCTGVLTISGSGAMTTYVGSDCPWYSYRLSIKTAVIENGVTSIGNNAFYHCTGLTSVTIPDSVTSIGVCAFVRCTGLTSVIIPASVTNIGSQAFEYCTKLTSVTIPDSVTYIGFAAFSDCAGLTSINVDINNLNYKSISGVLFNKDGTTLISYPAGKSGSYTILSSITYIGDFAFSGCSGLTSVTIPDSVTNIGEHAFWDCSGLTSVTYKGTSDPGSSSHIFSGYNNLYRVLVPSDYKSNTFCGIPVTKRTSSFTSTFKPSLFKFGFMLL